MIPQLLHPVKKNPMLNLTNLHPKMLIHLLSFLLPIYSIGQTVENVPRAFAQLSVEPELILLDNAINVPTESGHLQGVQWVEVGASEKLLISGSSRHTAYLLQANLDTKKTELLIPLMREPFRHAGGIQVSDSHLVVGIEDNHLKTIAKLALYQIHGDSALQITPSLSIHREGAVERYTAGATGLIQLNGQYLVVVGNWDSRNWDFYLIDPEMENWDLIESFDAPADWASYQSINLIKDQDQVYAIGLYGAGDVGRADLILISNSHVFKPVMSKISSKVFHCVGGVDFNTAAGIQVDSIGNLHLWATQRDAFQQISVNRYAPKK